MLVGRMFDMIIINFKIYIFPIVLKSLDFGQTTKQISDKWTPHTEFTPNLDIEVFTFQQQNEKCCQLSVIFFKVEHFHLVFFTRRTISCNFIFGTCIPIIILTKHKKSLYFLRMCIRWEHCIKFLKRKFF